MHVSMPSVHTTRINGEPEPTGPAPMSGRCIKISMFFNKHPDVTDEYFHAYWANNHLEPLLKIAKFKEKIRRYNQHHVTPELREQAKSLGMPVLDFDGIAEIWVDSMEDWKSITSDPEFRRAGANDGGKFILQPAQIMLGFDHLVLGAV